MGRFWGKFCGRKFNQEYRSAGSCLCPGSVKRNYALGNQAKKKYYEVFLKGLRRFNNKLFSMVAGHIERIQGIQDIERIQGIQKMFRTSSEHLMYVQFTSRIQGVLSVMIQKRVSHV